MLNCRFARDDMPSVFIDNASFDDLKLIARHMAVETLGEAVHQIIRKTLSDFGLMGDDQSQDTAISPIECDRPQDLAHTRPTRAVVDGITLSDPYWVTILDAVLAAVMVRGNLTRGGLEGEINIPTRLGAYNEKGYKYHPTLGISIQGLETPRLWREIVRLARKHKFHVDVEFEWKDKPESLHPKRKGVAHSSALARPNVGKQLYFEGC